MLCFPLLSVVAFGFVTAAVEPQQHQQRLWIYEPSWTTAFYEVETATQYLLIEAGLSSPKCAWYQANHKGGVAVTGTLRGALFTQSTASRYSTVRESFRLFARGWELVDDVPLWRCQSVVKPVWPDVDLMYQVGRHVAFCEPEVTGQSDGPLLCKLKRQHAMLASMTCSCS